MSHSFLSRSNRRHSDCKNWRTLGKAYSATVGWVWGANDWYCCMPRRSFLYYRRCGIVVSLNKTNKKIICGGVVLAKKKHVLMTDTIEIRFLEVHLSLLGLNARMNVLTSVYYYTNQTKSDDSAGWLVLCYERKASSSRSLNDNCQPFVFHSFNSHAQCGSVEE